MTKHGFEFFSGANTEGATLPRITIRRNGLLVLTQAAVEMLDRDTQHVRLGFNPKTGAVGIQNAPEGTSGRYLLRQQKNGRSRLVDGKRFFAHLGKTFDKAQTFPAEDFGGGIIGFKIPTKK